ncbi:LuxR C-terminal-related transcriptional regulator [Kibdelosporangium philippinense]|uniref:LuxR C-terminal-related transcriptional regulator n=1 Tax=Kibdelosporangium philippinense TaxID=211113 RepID=A0ABS8Z394_9PSEU|nr:LuxR C-terminal-related transcriptional regulator [Kibdelosporangium philippinense]MCE7002406.1 LuxR C-terminal-related transcriptional regulator [Kibdelosporangium philippinense]
MREYVDQFSPEVASVVRDVDRRTRTITAANRFELYDKLRAAMGTLWTVDSFVVSLLRSDNVVIFPYSFDEGKHLPPDFHTYGSKGFTAWMVRNRRTYRYRMDNGKILHRGYRFGDSGRLSKDAVIVPLLDQQGHVFGTVAMYAYLPNVYDNEAVAAFEYLVSQLAKNLLTGVRRELGPGSSGDTYSGLLIDLIGDFTDDLQQMTGSIDQIMAGETDDVGKLKRDLSAFQALCRDVNVKAVELIASRSVDAARLMNLLTPKEKTVASLIAHGMTNRDLAGKLSISEATAKTHITRILKKFNVRQRSEIAARIFPMVQFGGAFHLADPQ